MGVLPSNRSIGRKSAVDFAAQGADVLFNCRMITLIMHEWVNKEK